ncbi:hypothetical protein SAMN04487897_10997 [Paenibacillus sp. yr247]|uniref:hypothetical protein n=1 Tax=Paenibacillus sp. yr247 TaxID=1761880 RepID=UPI00088E9149|nr:hypothetical protein [Paenibacillus sp. yr247]SDO17324.1 hypothetical protein SAMN04487897_10997 [Paenibacillus sp. yr247]
MSHFTFSISRFLNQGLKTRTLGEVEVDEILMKYIPNSDRVYVNCPNLAETIALTITEFLDELWTANGEYIFQVCLPDGIRVLTADEFKAEYPLMGYEFSDRVRNELYGKPKLVGFNGPMWNGKRDGVPVIRYEHPKS